MDILITGGSGFLGINLTRYLLAKNEHRLVILDVADFDYPERDRVKFIRGDIRDKNAASGAMDGIDIVIHAAAALPLYKKKEIYSTEVDGTGNLLEAAYRNHVKRFIHISSTAVYGIPDHHPLYENDSLSGVGDYGKAKIAAEELCAKYRNKGMCVPILRPKSFIGPERLGVFVLLYEWAMEGKAFPVLGSGNNRYQFLDVEDLCEAIFLCMTKDEAKANDTFNVGAKEFTTLKEDFQAVLDEAGHGKKIVPLPAWPVTMALRLLELSHLSPLYEWIYGTVYKDSFVSIEKAEKNIGFSPKYSNKESLLRNYRWYVANIEGIKNKTGISHRVPWEQGALKIAKIFF